MRQRSHAGPEGNSQNWYRSDTAPRDCESGQSRASDNSPRIATSPIRRNYFATRLVREARVFYPEEPQRAVGRRSTREEAHHGLAGEVSPCNRMGHTHRASSFIPLLGQGFPAGNF